MKKRVLAGMMAGIMVLASAMCVSAAPSIQDTATVVVPGSSGEGDYKEGDYVIIDNGKEFDDLTTEAGIEENIQHIQAATGQTISEAKKAEIIASYKAAVEIINKIDAGKQVGTDEVRIDNGKIDEALKDKKVVKSFFDLHATGDKKEICYEEGKTHKVTISVPGMTSNWKNIVVLHYSTIRTVWETIVPQVDYSKKTLTIEVQDLSPIAIYADIVEDSAAGTSPSTEGVSSAWMLYSAMALIVLGTGVVVYQKKRG